MGEYQIQFSDDFKKDIEEAFEYWRSKNKEAANTTLSAWLASITSQTVYGLIAEKRINAI